MSYEIVKKIEIDETNKKVYITGSSNNVWPRTPHRWECSYYQGQTFKDAKNWKEAIELDILGAYDSGNFQGTTNKYTKALNILLRMPEYKKFSWRDDWENYRLNKDTLHDEYISLLKKAFATKQPKTKFIITKTNDSGQTLYGNHRKKSRYMNWSADQQSATKFTYEDEAVNLKKGFSSSDNWQIVQL